VAGRNPPRSRRDAPFGTHYLIRRTPIPRILVLLIILTAGAAAQSVSGVVQDDTGAPLADLRVSVINQQTQVEKEIRSDPDGTYTLSVDPGTYSVGVEKPGRGQFMIRDVTLAEGETRTVNLQIASRAENRNFLYMFYGFLAAWLVLVIYVLSLVSRERTLRRQIDDLKEMVESERRS
jgi:CcmD family protein